MKNRIIIHAAALLLSVTLMMPFCTANAEGIGADTLMTGRADLPLTVTVSGPEYAQIARFGTDRTDSLNKILKHLGLSVTLDGNLSETVVTVDDEPAFSFFELPADSGSKTVYSFDPDTVYLSGTSRDETGFALFLENEFFFLNTLLDDLYPVFEKTADTFSAVAKSTEVSLNFRGYGKGVRQTTIALSAQYVSEHFPAVIADLAKTEESRAFINRLLFSGPQKILLLYDENDRLLRIRYDGEAGFTAESMRNVSVLWRCLRTETEKKDNLTLKTPAKKGGDRYNLTYEREILLPEDAAHTIAWDLQIDRKDGQVRKKDAFTAELSSGIGLLSGKIVYSDRQEGTEEKLTIVPSLTKENDSEYTGTIEITNNSGKIVTSRFTARVAIRPGNVLSVPPYVNEYTAGTQDPDADPAENPVREWINSILVRKMLALPPEDLVFFSMDIPADTWNSLVQSY